jgi:hypothetical protein
MFYDDLECNSVCFYISMNLIRIFGVTGKNRSMFLLPTLSPVLHLALSLVLHLTLHPTLRPAQKRWVIWRLWYWRPVVGESETWVFLVLVPSSY